MIPKSPCYNCEERHDLCHSHCERYLKYREELDGYNEVVRKSKEEACRLNGYEISKRKRKKK